MSLATVLHKNDLNQPSVYSRLAMWLLKFAREATGEWSRHKFAMLNVNTMTITHQWMYKYASWGIPHPYISSSAHYDPSLSSYISGTGKRGRKLNTYTHLSKSVQHSISFSPAISMCSFALQVNGCPHPQFFFILITQRTSSEARTSHFGHCECHMVKLHNMIVRNHYNIYTTSPSDASPYLGRLI